MKIQQKNILIAPLNWGLGHATRCIPIIKALENNNFTPIIASDGAALQFLKLEFPHLQFLELPSYKIVYPKNGKYFRWKMLQNIPNIILSVAKERKLIQKWTSEYALLGIISDNRLGVFSKRLPSVFITHQLSVLTGFTTFFSFCFLCMRLIVLSTCCRTWLLPHRGSITIWAGFFRIWARPLRRQSFKPGWQF